MSAPLVAVVLAVSFVGPAPETPEAQVSLDAKDVPVGNIVSALAEVGRLQIVFDPAPECTLTLKVRGVRWRVAFESALRACRLAYEEEGGVVRVAPLERLNAESDDRRRLAEEHARSASHSVASFRLSYARAAEIAPIVKRLLAPRGDVVYDARTNTLIIVD